MSSGTGESSQSDPEAELLGYFRRNGYMRLQDPERVANEGSRKYRKGNEVRLVAGSMAELRLIRRLLFQVGLVPGRPFRQGRQHRQPIYGPEAIEFFSRGAGRRRRPK